MEVFCTRCFLKEAVGCSPQCRRNCEEKKEDGIGFLKQREKEEEQVDAGMRKGRSLLRELPDQELQPTSSSINIEIEEDIRCDNPVLLGHEVSADVR